MSAWNRRYKKLGPKARPDRRKGDQFRDAGNGLWILTEFTGQYTVERLCWGTRSCYRRPIKLRKTDLHEHTASST